MKKRDLIEEEFTRNPDFNREQFAKEHGISRRYLATIIAKLSGGAQIGNSASDHIVQGNGTSNGVIDYRGDNAFLQTSTTKIKTAEAACDYAGVDMDKWRIDGKLVNFWDVTMKDLDGKPVTATNYQIKVWLVRKRPSDIDAALERLVGRIPKFKYSKFTPTHFGKKSKYAAEIAIMDAHMGKLAWAAETQQRDYDLKISVDDYLYTNRQNLTWVSPFNPSKIFYILGQDLMHTENYEGITPRGKNVLDVDSRLPKIIDAAIDVTIKNIYECRSVAPTEVIWIPGNHDPHSSLWLSKVLEHHFRKDKFVSVDSGPSHRKARLWGKLLVGWCHEIPPSKVAVYANEMAQVFRKEWAQAKYVEWHHGHKHKKSEVKTSPTTTHGGVLMRQLTALSPIDFWHYENTFTDAVPGGESFVWHKDLGVIANFTAWTGGRK